MLATPAEGLSGRFTRLDRKRYGVIPGVTDRDYYVNSFHVDVREPVSIVEKIRLEAPFHAITRGGHITYVELDGEAKKNPVAILKIVKVMQDDGHRLRLDQPSDRHLPQMLLPRGDLLEVPGLRLGGYLAHAPHHGLPDRKPRIVELRQAGRGARPGEAPLTVACRL